MLLEKDRAASRDKESLKQGRGECGPFCFRLEGQTLDSNYKDVIFLHKVTLVLLQGTGLSGKQGENVDACTRRLTFGDMGLICLGTGLGGSWMEDALVFGGLPSLDEIRLSSSSTVGRRSCKHNGQESHHP